MSDPPAAPAPRRGNTLSKWLALTGFGIVLALVVILLVTPGADGYNPSIYEAYPWYFWVLAGVALFLGQFVILRGALDGNPVPSSWRLGFVLSLLVAGILLFMPYIRGYPAYGRADPMSHVGHMLTIQETGGAPFQNIYQNLHQFMLAFSYATGLEPIEVVPAVAALISLFSILATYVLLSTVLDRRRVLLSLPFLVVLIGGSAHLNASPYTMSVFLFPFLLYLFAKTQQTESVSLRLLLTVVVVSVLLYHPLTAAFLVFIFLIHRVVVSVASRVESNEATLQLSEMTSTHVMQLSLVTFVAWYYNFVGIIIRFETVFQRLLDPGSSETELDTYGSTVSEYSPALSDVLRVALIKFGQRAVLLGFGLVCALGTGWTLLRRRRLASPYLVTFALGFVLFSGFGTLFLVVDLIGGFGRPLMYASFFAVFLAGAFLHDAYAAINRTRLVTVFVSLLLIALLAISLLTLYPSPMGSSSTPQVTEQDLSGAEWYIEHDLETADLQEMGIRMYRFDHALTGFNASIVQQGGTQPPARFNYTRHATFGESYGSDQVFVLTERARLFYPVTYPDYEEFWRFRPADFDRLERDPSVSHVYDNGEFDVYLIDSDG
jgi:hypothetical protein